MLDDLRILVVDDEADTRDLICNSADTVRREVSSCGSAAEALSAVHEWSPDLLISDIGLPEEDGFSLIKKVRHWRGNPGKSLRSR